MFNYRYNFLLAQPQDLFCLVVGLFLHPKKVAELRKMTINSELNVASLAKPCILLTLRIGGLLCLTLSRP